MFVMVSGPPGAGKSTLARPIADQLQLPLIAKDAIKEALMDVLGYPTSVEESRTLGRAAVMAMLNVAAASHAGAVLDSTFFPYAFVQLRALPGPLVEVHCRCPREVAIARYTARSHGRHAGHLDAQRQPGELWNEGNTRPTGIAPAVLVDTTTTVDVVAVVSQINELAGLASTK
jgi:adenylate kinase family enzyme